MKLKNILTVLMLTVFAVLIFGCNQPTTEKTTSATDSLKTGTVAGTDPLPSWNEGASKQSIIGFITKTTKEGGADFVPVTDRIACFDNDGTLWAEKPLHFNYIL